MLLRDCKQTGSAKVGMCVIWACLCLCERFRYL